MRSGLHTSLSRFQKIVAVDLFVDRLFPKQLERRMGIQDYAQLSIKGVPQRFIDRTDVMLTRGGGIIVQDTEIMRSCAFATVSGSYFLPGR